MSELAPVDRGKVLLDKRQLHAPDIEPVWDGASGAVVFARGSFAVGFSGTNEKPDFAGDFVSEDVRRKAVSSWLASLARKRRARRTRSV
jgi:hypothetical protein